MQDILRRVRLPLIISSLNILQGDKNRSRYCVSSTHESDDGTEVRNDYFQLVGVVSEFEINILYVANNARKTYIEHIFLLS